MIGRHAIFWIGAFAGAGLFVLIDTIDTREEERQARLEVLRDPLDARPPVSGFYPSEEQ